jgi:signal transduction histidine kinase
LLSGAELHRRNGNGSGLELQVARDLARAFDGDVVFEPTEGPGNTFVLKLPSLPPERSTARVWIGAVALDARAQVETTQCADT